MNQWDPPEPRRPAKPSLIERPVFGFPVWGWLTVIAAAVLVIGWGYDPLAGLFD